MERKGQHEGRGERAGKKQMSDMGRKGIMPDVEEGARGLLEARKLTCILYIEPEKKMGV